VLLELFGGICAGLDMVLRNGIALSAYFYVDHDPTCRAIASHRIRQLMAQFPHLLPATAVAAAFTALPHDVWDITHQHLQCLSVQHPQQWLVVGGGLART
jgi:CHAD domain-containing protein